jgi:hypothetical protein
MLITCYINGYFTQVHSVYCFFCCEEGFEYDAILCLFLLLFLVVLGHIQKKSLPIVIRNFSYVFFWWFQSFKCYIEVFILICFLYILHRGLFSFFYLSRFHNNIYWRDYLLPIMCSWHQPQISRFISGLSCFIGLFLCHYHEFDYYNFLIYLKSGRMILQLYSFILCLFGAFYDLMGILGFFLLFVCLKCHWNFDVRCLESVAYLG